MSSLTSGNNNVAIGLGPLKFQGGSVNTAIGNYSITSANS